MKKFLKKLVLSLILSIGGILLATSSVQADPTVEAGEILKNYSVSLNKGELKIDSLNQQLDQQLNDLLTGATAENKNWEIVDKVLQYLTSQPTSAYGIYLAEYDIYLAEIDYKKLKQTLKHLSNLVAITEAHCEIQPVPATIIDIKDLQQKAHSLEKIDGESEIAFTARIFADTDFRLKNGDSPVKSRSDHHELEYSTKRFDTADDGDPLFDFFDFDGNTNIVFQGKRVKLHVANAPGIHFETIDQICVDLAKKYNSTCKFVLNSQLEGFLADRIQANKFLTVYYTNASQKDYLKYEVYFALELENRLKQAGLSLNSIADPILEDRIKHADGLDLPEAFAGDDPTGLICFRHEGAQRERKRTLDSKVMVQKIFLDVITPMDIRNEEQKFNNAYLAAKRTIHNEFIVK